jgi:hypothetical protein
MADPKFCRQCGTALTPAARFCAQCGLSLDTAPGAPSAAPAGAPAPTVSLNVIVPWFVLASVLMVMIGYFIGTRGAPPATAAVPAGQFGEAPIVAAPDISSLSPEERVDRLFNRVMALAAAGQDDSVSFFAPMAINALAALMPLDAHRRYDLGLIHLAAGDAAQARAQADTILAKQPAHLLGLALAMRAATSQGRSADAKRLGAKLTASAASERAKGLREYADHAPDITEAIEEAAGTRTSRISQPR